MTARGLGTTVVHLPSKQEKTGSTPVARSMTEKEEIYIAMKAAWCRSHPQAAVARIAKLLGV